MVRVTDILKKGARFAAKAAMVIVVAGALVIAIPNGYEIATQAGKIRTLEQASEQASQGQTYDCIMVLGASVQPDGQPSTILADRIDVAVELYRAGVAPKIVMSGDNLNYNTYDEVGNMKAYAVAQGVPSEDVFCDHAGLNTYDSMYRAFHVFQVNRMAIVTQTYHLYRALYDADRFGITCIGIAADRHEYTKQAQFSMREVFARASDMGKVITNENATILSEPVSLDQSGDVTTW
ncbi:SanA/YdcF family protein [Curtanaerobium respiraculi]|jgi:vancomycin permeability regulator SanA|uniref:SanA/YdcF family protein n=1 Tax=Curtanaerobium respiraculi TaxID=2949669 RepID=UPI0024B34757|nr:ElyC/SanA/YdcF family protein [Curtanaerobium respiraculi]